MRGVCNGFGHFKEMFEKALKSDYAIGAFNVNNMEIIQGIVDAAKAEDAP